MVTNVGRFGTEKAQEPLRRANAAGNHLLSLINEVLDLSKIEAGKMTLTLDQFNVDAVPSDIRQMLPSLMRSIRKDDVKE